MASSPHHHRWHYIELPVTDLAAAKAFYSQVFGWSFEDWGPEYCAFIDAGLDGGLARTDVPPTRGGPIPIVYSDDLAASEAAVIAAGGVIVARHDFPGGTRFHFTDPAGNELAVWTQVSTVE